MCLFLEVAILKSINLNLISFHIESNNLVEIII